jgi:hypothetical protein
MFVAFSAIVPSVFVIVAVMITIVVALAVGRACDHAG